MLNWLPYIKALFIQFLICFLLVVSSIVHATQVLLITPSAPGEDFWDLSTNIAKVAAKNLGLQVDVLYADLHQLTQAELILKVKKHYDYAIFLPLPKKAVNTFKVLNNKGIYFITLERATNQQDQIQLGRPQEKYPYWLAEIYYDDEQAGQLLSTALIREAKRQTLNLTPQILAFSGDYSYISEQRLAGLNISAQRSKIEINQVIYTLWKEDIAQLKATLAIRNYPNTNIIWSASDQIALAIASRLQQIAPQGKWIIGGINATPSAISAIQNNLLTATIGGHFMQVAWAMLIIYDHSQGVHTNNKQFNMPLKHQLITQENAIRYSKIDQMKRWQQVNFKQFSLLENPQHSYYQFDMERLVGELQQQK